MNWDEYLDADETLSWEGRPMPRCYVFKRWKDYLFGGLLLALSSYWQLQGIKLTSSDYPFWIALIPAPFVIGGLYLSIGKLVRARHRWEQVFYAISNQRVLQFDNDQVATLALPEVTYFKLDHHGEQLGSLEIFAGSKERCLTLECIEYPAHATDLLETAMTRAGHLKTSTASASKSD